MRTATIKNITLSKKKLTLTSLIEKGVLFTIFFPYVPGLFPANTQPWFLFLFILLFLVKIISKRQDVQSLGFSKSPIFTLLTLLFLSFVVSIFYRILLEGLPQIGRVISFVQFLVALVYGLKIREKNIGENFFFVLIIIYLFFTGIYFGTNGAIESILVHTSVETEQLFSSGRGAGTLSGEPSFFALTMFNIYIIKKLLYPHTTFSKKKDLLFVGILLTNMILSFSGMGIFIALAILVTHFPTLLLIGFILMPIAIPLLFNYLEASSVRAFVLLRLILEGRGGELIDPNAVYGASFGTRIGSFFYYLEKFLSSPILGGGFIETNRNGGLISFLAETGVTFLILLLTLFRKIFLNIHNLPFKGLLFFWFCLRALSGGMGIPGVGIIIGLIISTNRK